MTDHPPTERDGYARSLDLAHEAVEELQAERDRWRSEHESAAKTVSAFATELTTVTGQRDDLAAELARLRGYQTVAEQRIEELCREFPACPECGCRAPDDPDRHDCGCDAGCNDGENPPGVQVLMDENARLREQLAALEASAEADVRPAGCICIEFRDTGGVRVGDLTCPVHGAHGSEPLDAPRATPAAQTPAPGARSAPRARRAARVGPGKGAEAQEAPVAAEGGSEGEGFSA